MIPRRRLTDGQRISRVTSTNRLRAMTSRTTAPRGVWIETAGITAADKSARQPAMAAWMSEPSSPNGAGIVVLPAAGYAYSSSHRALRTIAERLAAVGFVVLRVDYPGTGDSALDASDITDLTVWREALGRAVRWLRAHNATVVGVVGIELGASIALTDGAREGAFATVAIAPVYRGRSFVRSKQLLGMAVPDDPGAVTAGGHHFSRGLCRDISDLSLSELVPAAPAPLLLVDGANSTIPSNLSDHISNDESSEYWSPEGIPGFLECPAEEALPDASLADDIASWMAEQLPDGHGEGFDHLFLDRCTTVAHVNASSREEFVVVGPDELRGVLTSPVDGASPNRGLFVLLNSGSDPHTGPGRAWVELSRMLSTRGWDVLRVDLRGWGESPDGPNVPARPYDAHASADVAALAADLRSNRWSTVILGGLCAGAWIAMDVARSIDIDGVLALNPQLYWQPGDPVEALMSTTRERRSSEIAEIKICPL